jgi:putative NADH-flavin reductase
MSFFSARLERPEETSSRASWQMAAMYVRSLKMAEEQKLTNQDVTCLIQPASASKPSVQALKDRGTKVVVGDITGELEALVEVVRGFDTVISTINAFNQRAQLALVDAAAKVGVKRFVPCCFTIVRHSLAPTRDC